MGTVHLAFLWHFHQPCYRDLPTGKMLMPWVRLHGIKDYTGLAAILEEFPKIRCTTNFSPVLLDQLQAYIDGSTDTMLDLSLVPANELNDDQKESILAKFFWAHPDSVIGQYPRYRQLQELHRARQSLREQDYRDLQVLANLAWFHPLTTSIEPLRSKGRGFTEEDKLWLVARMRETLAQILPRWRAMSDRVELSVSPYYHPIVPLLCDFASAREAIPGLPLPDAPSFRDEADIQVRRAMEAGERYFGRRPRGFWPSEGSVSNEALALFRAAGAQWAATDEAIIGESGAKMVKGIKVAFRDTALSNLLGFTYKTMDPADAARDFVGRLEGRDGPVPVCLDGENPWEHYGDGGVAFLRALFRELSEHPRIRTVTMSELPAAGSMDSIVAGSWINRNFGVWIGHPEDRKGWELLGRAYRDLKGVSNNELAWECLRAAEGSDWYWWFGDDFSSAQDAEFDALFRRHVMNVYKAIGRQPPEDVHRPIKQRRSEVVLKQPMDLLRVKLDGRRSDYFEWIAAGHYDMSREYSALAGESSFLSDVYYGFDEHRLLLRLDFRKGVDGKRVLAGGELTLIVTRPRAAAVPLSGVVEDIFEGAVPFSELGLRPGEDVEFFLEFERSAGAPIRLPTLTPLTFRVPTREFDGINWQV
ncbi:MAG TPA: glycoside hydrolase family 57 protein [Planctomycetota bacterium]|nr:glycoside hydrolase family 57 protein [Planctomycetota bacterium]